MYHHVALNKSLIIVQTISVLDEILTDFIIETCHAAALSASYSRRQKIKVDDFKFVLRKDPVLLGRVQEQLWRERRIKEARSLIDVRKEAEINLSSLVEVAITAGLDHMSSQKA